MIWSLSLIFISSVGLAIFLFGFSNYLDDRGKYIWSMILCITAVMLSIVIIMATGYSVSLGYKWYAAGVKAQFLNREYHTSYTQKEIFFASDVIDTIRELDRQRIELNGNLMKEKKND